MQSESIYRGEPIAIVILLAGKTRIYQDQTTEGRRVTLSVEHRIETAIRMTNDNRMRAEMRRLDQMMKIIDGCFGTGSRRRRIAVSVSSAVIGTRPRDGGQSCLDLPPVGRAASGTGFEQDGRFALS